MIRNSALYYALMYGIFACAAFLVIVTRGNRRAIRWKIAVGTLVLSLSGPVSLVTCRTGSRVETGKADVWAKEGWMDGDTYRKTATGIPQRNFTNAVQRKESAKRAAVLQAQYNILEYFNGAKVESSCCYVLMHTEMDLRTMQEVKGYVKGGSVLATKFDDEHNCTILYEVKMKDLKVKVTGTK